MDFGKLPRRKKKTHEIENYYKILGTRSNATPETIKSKYIEQVKMFPPETHPEQFQRIRRAYDTLRDPRKRSEYDLLRKYGGKLESMLEQAEALCDRSEWDKAARVYTDILRIDPNSLQALLGIGHVAVHAETESTSEEYYDRAAECAESEEAGLLVRRTQIRMLYTHNRPDDALALLDKTREAFPNSTDRLARLYCDVYMELGRQEEAWSCMKLHIQSLADQGIADVECYIEWIHMMIVSKKWNYYAEVQKLTRRMLKTLTDEEDRDAAIELLLDAYAEYWDAGHFREALLFIELAHDANPKDKSVNEDLQEAREYAAAEKEIQRMVRDGSLFPLVTMHAIEWLYEGVLEEEDLHSFRNSIPVQEMKYMEDDHEGFAAGIVYLRKKYVQVHRLFQEEWKKLFESKVAGMNREQRRRIR